MLAAPQEPGVGVPRRAQPHGGIASLVTSALVGHHVPDMQRDFGGFWFFYAGEGPA